MQHAISTVNGLFCLEGLIATVELYDLFTKVKAVSLRSLARPLGLQEV
jgi:hypothetical protein